MIAAIIQLSQTLGMEAVAEGFETTGHAAALPELGCKHGQGYLYGRPVPADAMTALLRGTNGRGRRAGEKGFTAKSRSSVR